MIWFCMVGFTASELAHDFWKWLNGSLRYSNVELFPSEAISYIIYLVLIYSISASGGKGLLFMK